MATEPAAPRVEEPAKTRIRNPKAKALTPPLTQNQRMRRRPLRTRDILEAEKLASMLNDRKGGMSYDDLADKYKYYDASGASKAVKRALELTIQESSEEVRKMEIERYDMALEGLRLNVEKGDARSTEVWLKVSERRAALMGLDAPAQTEVTVNANARAFHMRLDTESPAVQRAVHEVLRLRPAEPPVKVEGTTDDVPDDAEVVTAEMVISDGA